MKAALRPVVDVFYEFGAGWIPVQGDCVIGIFWDELAVERAICAGILAKTFSERHLVGRLTKKWPELPDTGFKIGVAMSTLLVKRIGRPTTPHQAMVWPGKAVNYAAKASQSADAGELIVTGSVWDALQDNDYITFSCDCSTPSPSLWHDHSIDRLEHDNAERSGRCLTSAWCSICGEEFCERIRTGDTHRSSVDSYGLRCNALCFTMRLPANTPKNVGLAETYRLRVTDDECSGPFCQEANHRIEPIVGLTDDIRAATKSIAERIGTSAKVASFPPQRMSRWQMAASGLTPCTSTQTWPIQLG